jgi:hypothetical protein
MSHLGYLDQSEHSLQQPSGIPGPIRTQPPAAFWETLTTQIPCFIIGNTVHLTHSELDSIRQSGYLDETVHISFSPSDLGSSVIVPKYTVQHHQTPSLSFHPASSHRPLSAHECHALPPPTPIPPPTLTPSCWPCGQQRLRDTSPPSPPWKSKKENFYPLPSPPHM